MGHKIFDIFSIYFLFLPPLELELEPEDLDELPDDELLVLLIELPLLLLLPEERLCILVLELLPLLEDSVFLGLV